MTRILLAVALMTYASPALARGGIGAHGNNLAEFGVALFFAGVLGFFYLIGGGWRR